MDQTKGEGQGGFLHLIGFDTAERAKATFLWVAPPVALSIFMMGTVSWILAGFNVIVMETWKFALAMVIATIVVTFTLALLRGLMLKNEGGDDADQGPERDRD